MFSEEIYESIIYENGCVRAIYEDNHMIAVVKPQGILSQGDKSSDDNLLDKIKEDIAVRKNKPGEAFAGLVHRLDRNTGGTMVFAKTSKGAARLSEELRAKRFKKTYFVLAEGNFEIAPEGEYYRDKLEKNENTNVVKPAKDGKECVLFVKKITSGERYTLCLAQPITGRTHQIRVQFSLRGHPLAGDLKYGAKINEGNFLGLWSGEVSVKHPTKDIIMKFRSIPERSGKWTVFDEKTYSEALAKGIL